MQQFKIALGLAVSVVLAGCAGDRMADAESKMAEVRNQPARPIEPLPKPQPIEDYAYGASDLRSPFMPPSLLSAQNQLPTESGVRPDLNRKKEQLENYDLVELVYTGRIVAPDGQQYALIRLPTGMIVDVKVGSYIGRSDGRILEITPTQINIEEIVPDARLGFVNKRAVLVATS